MLNPQIGRISSSWACPDYTPVTTRCAVATEKAHQVCIDLSVMWQAVGRSSNQDLYLFQGLCAAKSPDDGVRARSLFRRQADADYGQEYSTMAKLATGFVPDRTSTGTVADAQPRTPQTKAA